MFEKALCMPSLAAYGSCRDVISLDAVHLTGHYTGTLYTASAMDANDSYFLLFWGVSMDPESEEGWNWMLSHVCEEIKSVYANGRAAFVAISDKAKGILAAVDEMFPDARHALCVKHLEANFHKNVSKHPDALKQFWRAVRAKTADEYELAMDKVDRLTGNGSDYFKTGLNRPKFWAEHAFRWDKYTSNASEAMKKSANGIRKRSPNDMRPASPLPSRSRHVHASRPPCRISEALLLGTLLPRSASICGKSPNQE